MLAIPLIDDYFSFIRFACSGGPVLGTVSHQLGAAVLFLENGLYAFQKRNEEPMKVSCTGKVRSIFNILVYIAAANISRCELCGGALRRNALISVPIDASHLWHRLRLDFQKFLPQCNATLKIFKSEN